MCSEPKVRSLFRSSFLVTVGVAMGVLPLTHGEGQDAGISPQSQPVGVVSHVKVLSDKVPDVSSLEAWKQAFTKEGMSDEEKALAVWRTVVTFQHQDAPPNEFLNWENSVLDPIKLFNVYGYSLCSVASSHVQALARHAGLKARGWTINAHVVSEVFWDGSWHLVDSSLINYFPKADGKLAGVEEIVAGVKEWLAQHPDLKGKNDKLLPFMRGGGWRNGPEVLARCPFYDDNGWLPAATHGWYSTTQEYDGSTLFEYESGYSTGYQVNIQLRRGERLTRNWSHKGLHINMNGGGGEPGCMKMTVGKDSLRYTPKYGDIALGRVGNGTLEYDVPLADGGFRSAALLSENLACTAEDKAGPAVHVNDPAQPGVLVIRMPSSYVYLSGELAFKAAVGNGGQISVSFSDNNGLDWRDVAGVTASGEQRVDLKPLAFNRYDYRLKFVLKGAGTGLGSLRMAHDIQHSQRPLPALAQGPNTITFNAGPAEGTITLEGSVDLNNKGKQLVFTDFHPESKGLASGMIRLEGGTGEITFPVETPGDMARMRVGTFYRARDERDSWDVQVSFDGGQNFKSIGKLTGPAKFMGGAFSTEDIPAGTRKALVRYSGTQRNTTMVFNFRIDADYKEPCGGFAPVKVTYLWDEDGQPKQDIHVAKEPKETYTISCAAKPLMKSIILESAD